MTAEQKHTSGPWRYDYEPGYCGELVAADGSVIATFNDEPSKANARLIAAAPELLESLQDMLRVMEQHEQLSGCDSILGDEARTAIAKATGATHE